MKAIPRRLQRSGAFNDNPEGAQKLWDEGFRPMCASELKPSMVVAFRSGMSDITTQFGFGNLQVALIGDVGEGDVDGSIWVSTDIAGAIICDEDDEVWAK